MRARKIIGNIGVLTALLLTLGVAGQPAQAAEAKDAAGAPASPLDFKMKNIHGKDVDLSKYKGKVVLMVNVASECGLTPQYKNLVALHKKYAGQGLAILGFPANNFGAQEPGTDAEIHEFATSKFGVEFPMFSKIEVNGDGACDLYKHLKSAAPEADGKEDIPWNFTKFLVGKSGTVTRFGPQTTPEEIAAELSSHW